LVVRRGDVVLIVVPGELGKPRPAVVVQSDELGDEPTSVILIPMSSDIERVRRTRPIVEPGEGKGIRTRSQVMTDKIVGLPRRRIRGVLGHLSKDDIERVDVALLVTLGLTRGDGR
jgi:mRNA interferase MazF